MMKASQFARLLAPFSNRIRMMVARAVISTVNDDTKVQQMCIKLLAGEMKDKVERLQEYGFTSVPHPDMEAAVVFIAGDRSNPMIVAVGDRQYRLRGLKNGEVAIYTDEGDYIKLMRDKTIEVNTSHLVVNASEDIAYSTKKMTINADSLSIKTNTTAVEATGAIDTKTPTFTQSGMLVATGGLTWGGTAQGLGGGAAQMASDLVVKGVSSTTHTHECPDGKTGGPL